MARLAPLSCLSFRYAARSTIAGVKPVPPRAPRPLIGAISRDMAPGIQPVMSIGHPVFVELTLVSAAMSVASGVTRIAMFEILSTDLYVIVHNRGTMTRE